MSLNRFNKKTAASIIVLLIIAASAFFLISCISDIRSSITILNATTDVTENYAGYDFGITPTVKKYKNAVFDIEKIRDEISNEGFLLVNAGGKTIKIEFEEMDIIRHPDFVSYAKKGDGYESQISISDEALFMLLRTGDNDVHTDYFIDTTSTKDDNGQLIHYCYSSDNVGFSDEHNNLAGNILSPQYLGKNITKIQRETGVYNFTQEDSERFPVLGRFLKYGGQNLEISRKEAENIYRVINGKIVFFNGNYFSADYFRF